MCFHKFHLLIFFKNVLYDIIFSYQVRPRWRDLFPKPLLEFGFPFFGYNSASSSSAAAHFEALLEIYKTHINCNLIRTFLLQNLMPELDLRERHLNIREHCDFAVGSAADCDDSFDRKRYGLFRGHVPSHIQGGPIRRTPRTVCNAVGNARIVYFKGHSQTESLKVISPLDDEETTCYFERQWKSIIHSSMPKNEPY